MKMVGVPVTPEAHRFGDVRLNRGLGGRIPEAGLERLGVDSDPGRDPHHVVGVRLSRGREVDRVVVLPEQSLTFGAYRAPRHVARARMHHAAQVAGAGLVEGITAVVERHVLTGRTGGVLVVGERESLAGRTEEVGEGDDPNRGVGGPLERRPLERDLDLGRLAERRVAPLLRRRRARRAAAERHSRRVERRAGRQARGGRSRRADSQNLDARATRRAGAQVGVVQRHADHRESGDHRERRRREPLHDGNWQSAPGRLVAAASRREQREQSRRVRRISPKAKRTEGADGEGLHAKEEGVDDHRERGQPEREAKRTGPQRRPSQKGQQQEKRHRAEEREPDRGEREAAERGPGARRHGLTAGVGRIADGAERSGVEPVVAHQQDAGEKRADGRRDHCDQNPQRVRKAPPRGSEWFHSPGLR